MASDQTVSTSFSSTSLLGLPPPSIFHTWPPGMVPAYRVLPFTASATTATAPSIDASFFGLPLPFASQMVALSSVPM